jgi:hypothetical protein
MNIFQKLFGPKNTPEQSPNFAPDFGLDFMGKRGLDAYTLRIRVPLDTQGVIVEHRLGNLVSFIGRIGGQTYMISMVFPPLGVDTLKLMFAPPNERHLNINVRLHKETLTASTGERYRPLQVMSFQID